MNKQQTPLQRLIAEKEQRLKSFQNTPYPSLKVKVQINCIEHDIKRLKKLLPYEREVIENFGKEMQTIDYVCGNGIYHDVRFTFEPKELFTQTFQTNE